MQKSSMARRNIRLKFFFHIISYFYVHGLFSPKSTESYECFPRVIRGSAQTQVYHLICWLCDETEDKNKALRHPDKLVQLPHIQYFQPWWVDVFL